MNILAIDTSTDIELLALSADGNIYQFCRDERLSHSVTMFQNLSAILSEASIGISDIGLIGVGVGPGSFTGIRIAVSSARMFSQILKVPLVGIKSQEIYAASASSYGAETVVAAFDAKKKRVFGGVYRLENSITQKIIEPGDYTMEELLTSIKNPGELTCVGDGCEKYIEVIEEMSIKHGFRYKYINNFHPDGKAAIDLTQQKYNRSPENYNDYSCTIPFYTRKSDAEILKGTR